MSRPESFRAEMARMRRDRETAERRLTDAFLESPAVFVTEGDLEELWILSPELDPKEGIFRVTFFRRDGPRGHHSGESLQALVRELARHRQEVTPASDADVVAWTTTPEFEEGVKQVSLVQADNQLRYLAGRKGAAASAWAREVSARAGREPDLDRAIELLVRAAEDLGAGRAPNFGGSGPVRLWLDDQRPAPLGWVWAKTCAEALSVLSAGRVAEVSLDYDLDATDPGRDGMDVMRAVVRDAERSGRAPAIHFHTANPVGAAKFSWAWRKLEKRLEKVRDRADLKRRLTEIQT